MSINNTVIQEVQVYRQGAEITRKGTISLEEGRNRVRIAGLSENSDANSLKLFFPESVTGNNIHTINPAVDLQDEEKESDEITQKIEFLTKEIEILNEQQQLWKTNGNFQKLNSVDMKDMESYIEKLPDRVMEIFHKIAELGIEKEKLEKKLNKVLEQERKPIIEADFYAEKAGTYPFQMQYHDYAARWNPVYEVHTEGKGEDLEFRLRANIIQTTNEDWKDVQISLFTGNPSISNDLPILNPLYLNIRQEVQNAFLGAGRGMAKAAPMMMASSMAMADSAISFEEDMEETANFKRIETPQAEVTDNDTMTEYALSAKQDILSNNEGTIVDLHTFSIPADYKLIAVPKMDNHAYLCAEIKTEDLPVMIRGTASVYLNNAYAGNIQISPNMTQETFRISLGKDEKIQIQRNEIMKKNASALIRNQKTREQEYEILLSNKKQEEVISHVTDQIPVSQDKTITVDTLKTDQGKVDELTGKITWEITLQPNTSKSVHLAYRTTWPKDKDLQESRTASLPIQFCPVCGSRVFGRFCPECGSDVNAR